MDKNPYRSVKTEVLEVITETPSITTIRLRPSEPLSFSPGQFMEVSVPGVGEAPFTPSSYCGDHEKMDITIVKVGKVTEAIHRLKPGDVVGLRGPYGHGYPREEFKGKEVLVVGGGVGLAPLRTLMYSLFKMRGDLVKLAYRAGCRQPCEFLYRDEIMGWLNRPDLDIRLTTDQCDETWTCATGLVTSIMDSTCIDPGNAVGISCGPPVMMKFVTFRMLEMGIPPERIYLSMEKNMSCGFGKCGHCRLGTFYCCKDGPVFTYAQIKDIPGIWD